MGAAAPFIIPTLMMGGQAVIGHGQERRAKHEAEDAAKRAEALWRETAYPSAEAIEERRATGMGKLGETKMSAYENLARNLSVRGFGPGSGLMKRGAGGIEKGYLKGVSGMESELTKFQHTPMFAPPGQMYGGGMQYGGGGSDALSQAMGMMMAWSMLGGGGFGGGGGSTPDYNIDPDAYWPGLDW